MKQNPQKTVEKVVVCNENGLHIRPVAMISQCAAKFQSKIELEANGQTVDARSIIAVLLLAATKGTTVTILAEGPDHAEAAAAVAELFKSGFPLDGNIENMV